MAFGHKVSGLSTLCRLSLSPQGVPRKRMFSSPSVEETDGEDSSVTVAVRVRPFSQRLEMCTLVTARRVCVKVILQLHVSMGLHHLLTTQNIENHFIMCN